MSGLLFRWFMEALFKMVEKTLAENPTAIIGIDGCCAAGKTTLANQLAAKYGFQIIRMDDFFLPPEMRTAQRLTQAGGNIHYERFNNEVAACLKSGKSFEYNVFSCKLGKFAGKCAISPERPVIIEGSYSMHPEIPDIYDLKIFLKIDSETQLKRILERNGKDALEVFKSKWIPLENRYFAEFYIAEKCDIII